jgi:SAM-dependent methyltransferase
MEVRMQAIENDSYLCCPKCKNYLLKNDKYLSCQSCYGKWPIVDGIPSFSKREFYWNELAKGKMDHLLSVAEIKGWRVALHDILQWEDKIEYRYICDERRTDWRFLVPISKRSVALDIGSGWGTMSVSLSRMCEKIVSMDATYERIKFLNIRKTQEGIGNIYPVHAGMDLEFPFPNNYFDLAILVGVLEWFGVSQKDVNPHQAQRMALKNIYNLLKDGGSLYIGIENRFGYNYLMGLPDHNGLPFVSLMPRRLADFFSKVFKGEQYRTYQYSIRGYEKLLKEVGFSEIEFYAPLPQYREPNFFLPLKNINAVDYFLRELFSSFELRTPARKKDFHREYQVAKIGSRLGLMFKLTYLIKYIVPGFSIIAKK